MLMNLNVFDPSYSDVARLDPIDLCTTLTSAMKGNMIDHRDAFGQTPLHRAAIRGAGVCCMHLLQVGRVGSILNPLAGKVSKDI